MVSDQALPISARPRVTSIDTGGMNNAAFGLYVYLFTAYLYKALQMQ